ncbi:MAG: hypothetical protein AB1611_10540 [bacterium]
MAACGCTLPAAEGPRVYIAYEDRERSTWGLAAIDLTLPSDPVLVWSVDLSSGLDDLRVEEGYICLPGPGGPMVLGCADPADPVHPQDRGSARRTEDPGQFQ